MKHVLDPVHIDLTISFAFFTNFLSLYFVSEIPRKENKVAIVTGGNAGIGYETVKGLCKAGVSVIMGKNWEQESGWNGIIYVCCCY